MLLETSAGAETCGNKGYGDDSDDDTAAGSLVFCCKCVSKLPSIHNLAFMLTVLRQNLSVVCPRNNVPLSHEEVPYLQLWKNRYIWV
jgi:hypothetical protein